MENEKIKLSMLTDVKLTIELGIKNKDEIKQKPSLVTGFKDTNPRLKCKFVLS